MSQHMRLCMVRLFIVLVLGSVANASLSQGHAEAWLRDPGLAWTMTSPVHSTSTTAAWDSTHPWAENSDDNYTSFTSAAFDIGTASASSATGNLYGVAGSSAEPLPNEWAIATALGSQWFTFRANQTGYLAFTLDYSVHQTAQTALPGEDAWICGGVSMFRIFDASFNIIDGASFWRVNGAPQGTSGSWDDSGTLSIGGNFTANDEVSLCFYVESQGGANTVVPVPGAVILGALGLGATGVRLRRHA